MKNIETVAKLTLLPSFENKKGNYSGRCFYTFRSWPYKIG